MAKSLGKLTASDLKKWKNQTRTRGGGTSKYQEYADKTEELKKGEGWRYEMTNTELNGLRNFFYGGDNPRYTRDEVLVKSTQTDKPNPDKKDEMIREVVIEKLV